MTLSIDSLPEPVSVPVVRRKSVRGGRVIDHVVSARGAVLAFVKSAVFIKSAVCRGRR